jgi:hypothetical protein
MDTNDPSSSNSGDRSPTARKPWTPPLVICSTRVSDAAGGSVSTLPESVTSFTVFHGSAS